MDQVLTTFRELLTPVPGLSPGEEQRRASQLLPERVSKSRLQWWSPGDPILGRGRRLLIGAAVWSGYDMRLLDYVDAALADPQFADLTVDVFDCDQVQSPDGFEPYIPGIGPVSGTPVVGLWNDGSLVDSANGYHGRKLVAGVFGFDMQELTARSPTVTPR